MTTSKGKDACRWCEGDGREAVLGCYGLALETVPCPHCEGTGLADNPAPMADDGAYADDGRAG